MFNLQPGHGLGYTTGKEVACGLGTSFSEVVTRALYGVIKFMSKLYLKLTYKVKLC